MTDSHVKHLFEDSNRLVIKFSQTQAVVFEKQGSSFVVSVRDRDNFAVSANMGKAQADQIIAFLGGN